ncbi:MAG TPA: caspase family protein, partial [Chitinophagaceae bacterium]|nr:caspase family protein [Chitinophagaceae bacterium]
MSVTKRLSAVIIFISISIFAAGKETGISEQQTLVLAANQFPQQIKKHQPDLVYILFEGTPFLEKYQGLFLKKDTITNLKRFTDSLGYGINGYRILFAKREYIDSVWQFDADFILTDKVVNLGLNRLQFYTFNEKKQVLDQFILDYSYRKNKNYSGLKDLFRKYIVYTYEEKLKYGSKSVWLLSVGIDDYGDLRYRSSKADAIAYDSFFRQQFRTNYGSDISNFHSYVLLDQSATKDSILKSLRSIASLANANDYFIFSFSGISTMETEDSVNYTTVFCPYDVAMDRNIANKNGLLVNRQTKRSDSLSNYLISLKLLQEYIQLIPCTNQLFISEAGPSEKFKTEFVRTLMQNSPTLASMLNINRIIIVPNNMGYEGGVCKDGKRFANGPLAYFITGLEKTRNIYDLFGNEAEAGRIVAKIKSDAYSCEFMKDEYFDIFFERKFLQQYREIFREEKAKKRGLDLGGTEVKDLKAFSGKRHALIIGTDHYKAKEWDKLENPVYDASEIADVLKAYYDFEITLLKDPPMDTIYRYLSYYYKNLREDDQFIIYIAGHGDFDQGFLDDGFIVCTDSKSPEADPLRNTYIQHTKLKKMINKMPAKQLLVLLDICHGGVFDENVLGKTRDNPAASITNRNVLQLLKDKSPLVTRKVLSSVGKESAFDGKAGKHSPFATYLLKILNARGGTEGIITLSDIYALLQKASLNET